MFKPTIDVLLPKVFPLFLLLESTREEKPKAKQGKCTYDLLPFS